LYQLVSYFLLLNVLYDCQLYIWHITICYSCCFTNNCAYRLHVNLCYYAIVVSFA